MPPGEAPLPGAPAAAAGALERARASFLSRDYDGAARLARAATAGGDAAGPWALGAAALLAGGRPGPALRPARRARELAPGCAWAARLESAVLAALGRGREAVAAAEEAVRLAPDDPWAHDALARARLAVGARVEARAAAAQAVRCAPRDAEVVRRAGDAWLDGAPEAAEARYREALALDPGAAAAWDALASALDEQGRRAEAASARARAVRADPVYRERYRRQLALLPLLLTGAAVLLTVVALGLVPRLVPPALAGRARAAAWIVAVLLPALFAAGAAARLRRGASAAGAIDPQLADVVRRL